MLLFSLLTGCAPPAIDTSPSIRITWPLAEAQVESCAMVVVEIANFTLVDATNSPPVAVGEGHYHVEYPGSYALCYTPYCLVDLSQVDGTAPTLTAYLVGNDHQPILDAGENRYESSVPVALTQGTCALGEPQAYVSGWDTGGDSGGEN